MIEFNMEVVEACSPKSDVKCRCKAGYTCKKFDDYSKKCSRCKKDLTPALSVLLEYFRSLSLSLSRSLSLSDSPISMPAAQPACPSMSSSERIFKEESGVEPGWGEIIPRKRDTVRGLMWVLSHD